jgi:hypothetical protein
MTLLHFGVSSERTARPPGHLSRTCEEESTRATYTASEQAKTAEIEKKEAAEAEAEDSNEGDEYKSACRNNLTT